MKSYHIRINKNAGNLCMIILPREKYYYKRLPMGVVNSPKIFQHKTNDLFHGFEFICVYIDNILVLLEGDWKDHVQKL